MLDGSKIQLYIEFESLSEGGEGEKGSVAEAPRLKLAEVIVERALCAVLTDEAALDEGRAGGGRGTDTRLAGVRQQAQLAVLTGVVFMTDTGEAAFF